MGGPAIFLTDDAWATYRTELTAVAPDLEPVLLERGREVGDADRERIEIVCFSGDAWPERAAPLMRVALDAPNVRWFHTFSAGVDSPVFRQFLDRGVRLTTSSGASASPIAQTVLMYLLALSRDLPRMFRDQQARVWRQQRFTELEGQRVAVVGFGPIGQEVVRLTRAVGMEPVVLRRSVRGDEGVPARPLTDIAAVVADTDWVVLALPLTPDTHHLVDAAVLAAMRPGAGLVNVGRGDLVDEGALVAALRSGHVGCAALDVFATEPLPAESPLWAMPNVIVTPHNSGTTALADHRAAMVFVENLGRYLRGESMRNEVVP